MGDETTEKKKNDSTSSGTAVVPTVAIVVDSSSASSLSKSPTSNQQQQQASSEGEKESFNVFRSVVAIFLLLSYLAVWLTAIVTTSLPVATFNNDASKYYLSLWTNCTLGAPDRCHSVQFYCSRSRARFDVARAFSILSIIVSFFCMFCVVVAFVQLIRSSDIEAATKAIRGCIFGGLFVLAFSVVSFALVIVISVEPLCEGFDKLEENPTWKLGTGAQASAVQACFALVATCFGRIMEKRISTSKLGVE